MVIVEFCVWLPRKPRLHFNPGVIHESKIVHVSEDGHVDQAIYRDKKERKNEEAVIGYELNRTHGKCRVSSRRMVPVYKEMM